MQGYYHTYKINYACLHVLITDINFLKMKNEVGTWILEVI